MGIVGKCSKDTAIRDIQDLVEKNILVIDIPGAKRPSYSIVYDAEDLTQFFADVTITEEKAFHTFVLCSKERSRFVKDCSNLMQNVT